MLGLPLITFAALLFGVILVFSLVKWFTDDVYGVNNSGSYWLMGGMYALAIAIYVGLADRAQAPGNRPRDGLRGDPRRVATLPGLCAPPARLVVGGRARRVRVKV